MSRKLLYFVFVTLMVVSMLTACAQPTPIIQTVEVETVIKETQIVEVETEVEVLVTPTPMDRGLVEFGGFYPADSPWGKQYRLVGYRFEQENPDCQFKYSEYPGVEGGKAMSLRAKEGDPVSIAESTGINNTGTTEQIKKQWEEGLIYDLSADMATPAYGQSELTWLETFNSAAREYMVTEGGKIGSIPSQQTQIVLWYNQALYDQFELEVPTTWGTFMSNCEVLKQNGIDCIGGGGFNGYIGYWYDMLAYRLMGAEKMTKLYTHSDPAVKWTDPDAIKAAEMLIDMIDKGYTSDGFVGGDFTANQVAFFTGKSAHLFVGTWLIGEMKDSIPADFKMAVTYFPAIEGYENLTPYKSAFGFVNTIGMYNPGDDQKEPHSADCAVRYLKLLTSSELQKEMSSGTNLDYITTIKDSQGQSGIPGIGELVSGLESWFPFMAGASYLSAETSSKYWDNVANLAAGGLTPEEFGDHMQADWDDIFSRLSP